VLVMSAMVPNPLTVSADTSVLDLVERVLDSNQTTAVVLDAAGELLGVVSVEDVLRKIVPNYVNLDSELASIIHEGYFEEKFAQLAKTRVAEIMTKEVVTVAPTDTMIRAVTMSVHAGHKTFPVIDNGRFVGTITRRSILRCVVPRSV